MGWTVLYIAFGVVALWLLGEVLLQYKARLRWRLTAFFGFLTVVLGVLLPSVLVIALGTVAFALGQTFVTLSFRQGFDHGWALESSRRRKAGADDADDAPPQPADAPPVLEVSALEETAAYQMEPLPEDTGQYGRYERDADDSGPGHHDSHGSQGAAEYRPDDAYAAASYGGYDAPARDGGGLYQDPYLGGTGTPAEQDQHQYATGGTEYGTGYGDDPYGTAYPSYGDSGSYAPYTPPPAQESSQDPYSSYAGYDPSQGYQSYQESSLYGYAPDGSGSGFEPASGAGAAGDSAAQETYGYGYGTGGWDAYGYPQADPDASGYGQQHDQAHTPADGVWVPQQRESGPVPQEPYSYQDGYGYGYPAPPQRGS
ncbi:hypothetical protein JJV70_22055 [Streptomyces sp. JJ66]|uniref:hypothetical protein n=1 Tax=Streptomyces sp. JJ66 TaxID=2803843 RepID=UPI001C572069|nr:hypothetical protein [Streptomyces sp. JJ66]MBW1604729.1 hypothetical protein [Streptomyces sp. JJ66]